MRDLIGTNHPHSTYTDISLLSLAFAERVCVEAQVKTEVDKCSASLVKKIGKEKVEQAKLLCVEAQATNK